MCVDRKFDYSCAEHKKGRREDPATPWEEGGQGCRCVIQFQELLLHDMVHAVLFMQRNGEQAFLMYICWNWQISTKVLQTL
jgi:hypothetical protein